MAERPKRVIRVNLDGAGRPSEPVPPPAPPDPMQLKIEEIKRLAAQKGTTTPKELARLVEQFLKQD